MITSDSYLVILNNIIEKDPRYSLDAYIFTQEAVSYTLELLNNGEGLRHVSGRELLEGIRKYSVDQFGPMAIDMFTEWGISCTRDFGNIVFNMIDAKLLSARKEDAIEDFENVYNFNDVFVSQFTPVGKKVRVPIIA